MQNKILSGAFVNLHLHQLVCGIMATSVLGPFHLSAVINADNDSSANS